jgi:hypothetical protein
MGRQFVQALPAVPMSLNPARNPHTEMLMTLIGSGTRQEPSVALMHHNNDQG